jgi:hypothetical protein
MVKQLKNDDKQIIKRPRGRPKGTSPTFSSVILVRNSIKEAIDECEKRGRPLPQLIADEMIETGQVSRVLGNLARFLPAELNISVGNDFSTALQEVEQRMAEHNKIIEHDIIEDDEDS